MDANIKAMYFDELLNDLHSIREMYINFSVEADNIKEGEAFDTIATDLNTLLTKYTDGHECIKYSFLLDNIDKLSLNIRRINAVYRTLYMLLVENIAEEFSSKDIEDIGEFLTDNMQDIKRDLQAIYDIENKRKKFSFEH